MSSFFVCCIWLTSCTLYLWRNKWLIDWLINWTMSLSCAVWDILTPPAFSAQVGGDSVGISSRSLVWAIHVLQCGNHLMRRDTIPVSDRRTSGSHGQTLSNSICRACIASRCENYVNANTKKGVKYLLETVSIAEPLQNRQDAQNP